MTFPIVDTSQQSYVYRDAKGNTAKMLFYINYAAATVTDASTLGGNIATAINALTNAAFQAAHGPAGAFGTVQYGAHATGGAYESVIDKAVFVFQDANGSLHRFEVMAPKIAIFKTDKITVDPANTAVIAFNALILNPTVAGSFVCTRSGLAFVNYMGGFYKARKLRRKLNVLILQPDLTPALPAE